MSHPTLSRLGRCLGLACAGLLAQAAHAGPVGYQDQAAFGAAIAGWTSHTTDFEAQAAGTTYAAGTGPAGAGFTLTLSGPSAASNVPTVNDAFWTTSGTHYLGLDNFDTAFEAGDALTIQFATPVRAFGLWVIGTQDLGPGDIALGLAGTSISNGSSFVTDGFGSYAYFLGLVTDDSAGFSSLTLSDLTPGSTRLLNIAADDFISAAPGRGTPVPEPASLALVLLGLLALAARRTASH